MERYSVINTKMPREFILLRGSGCRWRRCAFCDYHTDTGDDPYRQVNRDVLRRVTGVHGVLDVINSGSAMELDDETISHLRRLVVEKHIHTLWFEAHYMYRDRLEEFAQQFAPVTVKFRCGVETFDPMLRERWRKGIPRDVTAADVARYFQGVCLLCCTKGETKERIVNDIELARRYFEYFSVNLFCDNSTQVERDETLVRWFMRELFPSLKDDERVEVLCENVDLGVG